MQLTVVQKVLGLLLALFSFSMLPPVVVAFIYQESSVTPFIDGFSLTFITGFLLWYPVRSVKKELRLRDGFLVVVLFWSVLGVFGALPLYLSEALNLSVADAVFESLSGLTTTGATVITGLDDLPKSILYYRQQLQWFGGMGIIVLAVAILPMLGIGGMQLYKAETPGPVKDSKLSPRITETAKALWYIYLGITVACAIAYWLAGMTVFEAIGHSFATVALGGFSTHDASMGYFNSSTIELIAIFFMLISGVNFALHFTALRKISLKPYWFDSEFKAYLAFIFCSGLVTFLYLDNAHVFPTWEESFLNSMFHTVSIATTAGFTSSEYYNWPGFLPVLLILMSFSGGCAGSTGGGMKVVRILLLFKQAKRELTRLVHPNAEICIKMGHNPIPERVVEAVWGFFAAYIGVYIFFLLLLMASGLDQVTAFSAVAACINNSGPGLGAVSSNFQNIPDFPKWVLSISMLMGRLEIFTLLVLLTPEFWRR